MPAIARKNQVDIVECADGTPGTPCGIDDFICDSPSTQATQAGSMNVFINGIGVVRIGDPMKAHPGPTCGCGAHQPPLSVASSKVFANGRGIGRVGDLYTSGHVISTGSSDVFDGSPQG